MGVATTRIGGRGNRGHRAGLMATGAMVVALFAGACSGGGSGGTGVAGAGSGNGGSSHPQATSTGKASALAYSQCMRSHGVPGFPDPGPGGGITIDNKSGVDPNSPQFKSADETCRSLQPTMPEGQKTQMKAAVLKYAQCMRSHGVTDFPDPNADGGVQIQATPGSDLTPDNPAFKSANEACKKLMPGGPDGGQKNITNGAGS